MDTMLRRRQMMAKTSGGGGVLPAEYQQVEYLQKTTNGVYIDTLIPISSLLEPRIVTRFRMDNRGDYDWFGSVTSGGIIAWNFDNNANRPTDYIRWLTSAKRAFVPFAGHSIADLDFYGDFYTLDVGGVSPAQQIPISVDSVAVGYLSASGIESPSANTIRVFLGRGSSSNAQCSFADFKIYSSGQLVCNLIPCYRKSDREPGMYDLVNNRFLTNSGTGTFVLGPDI